MDIRIDSLSLLNDYHITCIDHTEALGFASERENSRVWQDKSGIDKNLANKRYDVKEFVLSCYCKAADEFAARGVVDMLVKYMFAKGCFVLSFIGDGIRECFLCERSNSIVPSVHIRQQNSLYFFKIGLREVNPNALRIKALIVDNQVSINYTLGKNAVIYWGNGDQGIVTNSGSYTHTYTFNGYVDIIVDIDVGDYGVPSIPPPPPVPPLVAAFSATPLTGEVPLTVQFTNSSTGGAVIWAWDFGDGQTSAEQNPSHVYNAAGTFTVTLQVFNSVQGSDVETKTGYITVSKAGILISGSDFLLINSTDKILIN